uniref:Uncharacterized protein n=1 Tax=Hemiselmis andersenii TaxID=464988 RepID=A0A6U5CKJ4_HEMAN|mmetsp:Transcript_8090/g.19863  ORF Transcript_8090/g.19863 Transcript_8090/m.19863 type:complete len:269 (+) Transcript_8090:302-1108(+)|eukprot:CAMPEP_0169434052 /NCGR_PEP_ID=MMETSP1042-20121227/4322_1 /TAXON_ID=464988 /ORGANISM="Hemiselmis andersenii, Strain CCMP1180" /LENGTH=268 /DNA_ID=CAMNT_0009544599 /DNA_START=308 /DNA_END=1114 /DNA_ORIENTATION=+
MKRTRSGLSDVAEHRPTPVKKPSLPRPARSDGNVWAFHVFGTGATFHKDCFLYHFSNQFAESLGPFSSSYAHINGTAALEVVRRRRARAAASESEAEGKDRERGDVAVAQFLAAAPSEKGARGRTQQEQQHPQQQQLQQPQLRKQQRISSSGPARTPGREAEGRASHGGQAGDENGKPPAHPTAPPRERGVGFVALGRNTRSGNVITTNSSSSAPASDAGRSAGAGGAAACYSGTRSGYSSMVHGGGNGSSTTGSNIPNLQSTSPRLR